MNCTECSTESNSDHGADENRECDRERIQDRPLDSECGVPPRSHREACELQSEELRDMVCALAQHLASGTYELLVLVGELDARGSWARWGALSCAAWLASACDIDISTARSYVRVARAMRAHPVLASSMALGNVSYAKARVLAGYLTVENADDLIALAETNPAARLGVAIACWSQRHENPDMIAVRQQLARGASWHTEPDGMVVIVARLTPDTAACVCAAIDSRVVRDAAPAGAATLAQQRADALVKVATSGGSAPSAEVVVHVSESGNSLPDGTPLSDHAVAAMLPEAFVSLLMHDSARKPVDASPRRRFPTRRQKRIIDARSAECAFPGCHATVFLQYDHIDPYAEGGSTVVENLQRLCGPHNRAKHEHNDAA